MQYFPAFLDLNGRSCLVVGGGETAARKVRLLRKSGAEVVVVAPRVVDEIADLAADGALGLVRRGFVAGDVQGRQGVSGEVDRRFAERYGTALLLTGISTAVRFGTGLASGESDAQSGGTAEAADAAAEELSTRFGEISASVLEETLSLKPIITVPQGTRVQIRPAADWYIAKAE